MTPAAATPSRADTTGAPRRRQRPAQAEEATPAETAAPAVPATAREWVSFDDPAEDRTWLLDATFLASGWRCLYGDGCQGVLTAPAPERLEGCCSYGAHFSDADDVARVEEAAAALRADQWQHRAVGRRRGIAARSGRTVTTRLVGGACIFLNRPGFPGGAGCALHRAALEGGRPPLEVKPDVCWQLPLRREDHADATGHVTTTVTQWERRNWGPAGEEFAWWCTEAPAAFGAGEPVYRRCADELVALTSPAVYAMLCDHLAARQGSGPSAGAVPLPHPVVRRRTAP